MANHLKYWLFDQPRSYACPAICSATSSGRCAGIHTVFFPNSKSRNLLLDFCIEYSYALRGWNSFKDGHNSVALNFPSVAFSALIATSSDIFFVPLTHAETGKLNLRKLEILVRELGDLRNQGKDVVLVSSGAIAVGAAALGFKEKPQEPRQKQACAAVGQARLMMIYQKLLSIWLEVSKKFLRKLQN